MNAALGAEYVVKKYDHGNNNKHDSSQRGMMLSYKTQFDKCGKILYKPSVLFLFYFLITYF